MTIAAEALRKHFSQLTGLDGSSISQEDIKQIPLDSDVISRIKACISSQEAFDISTGFAFLNGLLEENKPTKFGENFFIFLVARLDELRGHVSSQARHQALELYVWLRNNYPDYKNVMKEYLTSKDLGMRRTALHHFRTYAAKTEISPLIHFSKDNYVAERSMCGPLFYELRDVALEMLGQLTGNQFCHARLTEPYNGTDVSWFDWSEFIEWWELERANYL